MGTAAERSSAQDLPSLAAAVEAALESRLGCGVTYIGSEEVFQEKAAKSKVGANTSDICFAPARQWIAS